MLLVLPACVLAWEGGDYIDAIAHASQPRWALALLIGIAVAADRVGCGP